MPNAKEIKGRINSIKETRKITNAMYLISSNKLRKAEEELKKTRPYFNAVQKEIKRVFCVDENIENKYFYPPDGNPDLDGAYGYLVITADKGLAGAYNQNILKETVRLMQKHSGFNDELYVVGEYGRHYFTSHGINIEKSFLYTAQNPTMRRAREICYTLLDRYEQGKLVKIYIIYTDYSGSMSTRVCSTRLLPFQRAKFISGDEEQEELNRADFEFEPSLGKVLDNIVPGYITGFIYSALVDSFCSEQNARMTAMDSANTNADEILSQLSMQYNHVRQGAITQEITEVSSGARSRRAKNEREA
ncbi:MAG: ATP synthase F1 subunit gamma [Clostridia bacterium]|nr:ATP synthase F1 subunit gamma [Clostridia bacterium]